MIQLDNHLPIIVIIICTKFPRSVLGVVQVKNKAWILHSSYLLFHYYLFPYDQYEQIGENLTAKMCGSKCKMRGKKKEQVMLSGECRQDVL